MGTDPAHERRRRPLVLGVLLYNEGTTGGFIDAQTVGSSGSLVAGGVYITGQLPLLFTKASMSAGATAPATLSGFAAAAAAFTTPLVILH